MSRIAPLVARSLLVGWVFLVCVGSIGIGTAQDCLEPPPGMIAWWPGDGDAKDIAGSDDGTPQNGERQRAG
jgi:hypothetical protein